VGFLRRVLAERALRTDLKTVTDSKDGDAEIENGGIDTRGVVVVDRVRGSGEDDTCRIGEFVGMDVIGRYRRRSCSDSRKGQVVESACDLFGMIRNTLDELTFGLPTEVLHLGSTRLHLTVDLKEEGELT